MQLGELLSSLLVNLQALMKREVNLDKASFPKIIALSIIPPDGLEMSALAKRMGIDNSTATRLVIGMEVAGWVNRESNLYDKRVTQVFLTKKGYSLQSDLEEQFALIGKVVEESLNPLDKVNISDSLSSLNWVLLKLIANK
jgi:DNA-binding MarR family transcriptional regulator